MNRRPATIQSLEGRQLLAAAYTLIDLGATTRSQQSSDAIDGNYYVSTEVTNGVSRGFYARLGAAHTVLKPLTGFSGSEAWALDGPDLVYGRSFTGNVSRATLWRKGVAEDLGAGTAYAGSGPQAVGTNGAVASIFQENLQSASLGTIFQRDETVPSADHATDFVNSNFIVGTADGRAFLYQNGNMVDLTDIANGTSGIAKAISGRSTVVVGQIDGQAFRTNGALVVGFLPRLSNNVTQSSANDVNELGEIVGQSMIGGVGVATLWQGAQTVPLADRVVNLGGWSLTRADSVDQNGNVLGYGQLNGTQHLFALVPGGAKLNSKGTLTLTGSEGNDVLAVSLKSGRLRVSVNGSLTTFTPRRVKRINISAGGGDDEVTLSSGVIGAGIDGGAGNDTLSGGDMADHLVGGAGSDKLTGYGGRDILDGGLGDDTLLGGSSIDTMDGGAGNDSSDFDKREKRKNIEILV